jgi:hypothetical protein
MHIEVDTDALQAAARARAVKDSALEAKACALLRQYGFFIRGPVKEFFHELAEMTFQTMQSVVVTNEELEHHGQAGYVVKPNDNGNPESKVDVKMDADNEVYEFAPSDLRAL